MCGLDSEPVRGGTEDAEGCMSLSLVLSKSLVNLEGMPVVVCQCVWMILVRVAGKGSVPRMISRMSHFGWRRASASIFVGVMIQRMTLLVMSGWTRVDLRVLRNDGMLVSLVRARRWIVARGIFAGCSLGCPSVLDI